MAYTLALFSEFKCLGQNCPAHCCQHWDVAVDNECFVIWEKLPESSARQAMLGGIRTTVTPEGAEKKILLQTESRTCIHLRPDGLCQIQSRYGHETLPFVCRNYPRIRGAKSDVTYFSLTMSCPEVARWVTQSKGELIHTKDEAHDQYTNPDVAVNRYLHNWTTKVLSKQDFHLNVRISVIAKTLAELAVASAKNQLDFDEIKRLCDNSKRSLIVMDKSIKKGTQVDSVTVGSFWSSIFNKIADPKILCGDRTLDSELLTALRSQDYSLIHKQIKLARSAQPLSKFDHELTRTLQVSLFNSGFPIFPIYGNHAASFLHGLLPYAMLVLLLRLTADHGTPLSQNLLIKAIYTIERWVGHNRLFLNNLFDNPKLLRVDKLYPVFAYF